MQTFLPAAVADITSRERPIRLVVMERLAPSPAAAWGSVNANSAVNDAGTQKVRQEDRVH